MARGAALPGLRFASTRQTIGTASPLGQTHVRQRKGRIGKSRASNQDGAFSKRRKIPSTGRRGSKERKKTSGNSRTNCRWPVRPSQEKRRGHQARQCQGGFGVNRRLRKNEREGAALEERGCSQAEVAPGVASSLMMRQGLASAPAVCARDDAPPARTRGALLNHPAKVAHPLGAIV